jgi:DNA repair exonuclease SbcCD ATPase subunit
MALNHNSPQPRDDEMKRTPLSAVLLGLLLLCFSSVLFSSEVDELRDRAKALRKKSSISAAQGNQEQAERLERESAELLEAAERLEIKAKGPGKKGDRSGINKEVQHLKERLQNLHVKEQKMREANASDQDLTEVREHISRLERELQTIHAHHTGLREAPIELQARVEKLEAANRGVHHMRVAARNFKIAEFHDLARHLMEKADAVEQDVQNAKQRLAEELREAHGHRGDHGSEVVRDLQAEVERLRAEVKELRQQTENR